jgi:Skp family chaperone for outer membrane proteins
VKSTRFSAAGWVFSALLLGVIAGSGFQTQSQKFGVVDLNRVIEKSDTGKKNAKTFEQMKKGREALLEFIDQNRVLTIEQANRLKELFLKLEKTRPEETEQDRIQAEVIAASKRSQELATKPNLTPEERTIIEEYARRSQTMNELSRRWVKEFEDEMLDWVQSRRQEAYDRARQVSNELGTREGYTLVFESSVAIYGANDVSDAVLDAFNKKQ